MDHRTNASVATVLKDRRIIPRWKSPGNAIETFEPNKKVLDARIRSAGPWIAHLSARFRRSPSAHTAGELYETAKLFGREKELGGDVRELSRVLQDPISSKTTALQNGVVANEGVPFTSGGSLEIHFDLAARQIKRLRKQLADYPGRPFGWSELARHYVTVGEDDKAVRAMAAALQLSRRSRYLSRAATRLFVHVDEPDRALKLLRENPALRDDPWLLAAEIAATSVTGRESHYIRSGERLIGSGHFTEMQLSELAAAVGTVELVSGGTKRAKVLFAKSLVDPTENSLAQAQWARGIDPKIVVPASAWKLDRSPEADALASRQSGSWDKVLEACSHWLAVEPFSSRPAILGSIVVFRPEHRSLAEQFATAGLRRDGNSAILLNNRAVARAYLGRTDEALADIKTAVLQKSGRDSPYILATCGLIAFRTGMLDIGREYYAQSIAWFKALGAMAQAASAVLHLCREELRANPLSGGATKEIARRILESPLAAQEPELRGVADALLGEVLAAERSAPGTQELILRPGLFDEIRLHAAQMHLPEAAKHEAMRLIGDSEKTNATIVIPASRDIGFG